MQGAGCRPTAGGAFAPSRIGRHPATPQAVPHRSPGQVYSQTISGVVPITASTACVICASSWTSI